MASPLFFPNPPPVDFRYEDDLCPRCQGQLKVLKSRMRQIFTLHIGPLAARETILHCPSCPGRPFFHSRELAKLVPEGSNFGYDVMVFAGRSLFLEHRTVDETVMALQSKNVIVSPSEIRELAARFVVSLGIAHLQANPALKNHLAVNGGYILHLDSTSRRHSHKLLTGIDEITGMVLLNIKLSTETGPDVAAFLRRIVARFGRPLAVACDMAAAIRCALAEVLPNVPCFICHFHFLRDAGKDLLQKDYQGLANLLEQHDITGKLQRLYRQLEPEIKQHQEEIEQFLSDIDAKTSISDQYPNLSGQALLGIFLASALEAEHQGDGLGFPFDRPKFAYYKQLETVYEALQASRSHLDLERREQRLFDRALKPLSAIQNDIQLTALAKRIEQKGKIFDELRTAMRMAEPHTKAGLNDRGVQTDIRTIKDAVIQFKNELKPHQYPDLEAERIKLMEQLDRHWDGLFRDPMIVTTSDGVKRTICPQRTNNILEHFFRDLNHREQRRTGTSLSAKRLNAMLPDTPLVVNLNNSDYSRIILDGSHGLEERFSRIDSTLVRQSLDQARRMSAGIFSKPRKMRKILLRITTPLRIAINALAQSLERDRNLATNPV